MQKTTETPLLEDIEQVSAGWINKYVLSYRLPNGESYQYESISRKGLADYRAALEANGRGKAQDPDAICILPMLPDGSVLLIREFRYAVNAWVIALPAGLMEVGESVGECVDRELREETGYRVRKELGEGAIRPLPQSGYSSVGMGDENVLVVIAQVEPAGEAQPEPSEFIETFTLPANEIDHFLNTNTDLIGTRAQLLLEIAKANK